MISLLTFVLLCNALASDFGARRYDAESHISGRSKGCGKDSPYTPGKTTVAKGYYAGVQWQFRVYVPSYYDKNKPMPIILQFPGWTMSAKQEEAGAGITARADELGYISVTPQGKGDNDNWGGPWYSWNAVGTTQSPGPGGPICTQAGNNPSYCYESCGACKDKPQCWWTTCDDGVTPTGTGTKDVGGYIPGLYNTFEEQLCIDTTREYAAGESNGGMMAYQVGVDMAHRLAAIFPQFGSFHRGFNLAPPIGLPVMDLHGFHDTTVPANVSLSDNGYYYTVTKEIFDGNVYSPGWKKSNGCAGPDFHYPTAFDGQKELYCVAVGTCPGGDVVRCAWNGGHNWFGNSAKMNGGLVTEFLLKWTRPSHAGGGFPGAAQPSEMRVSNITILAEEEPPSFETILEEVEPSSSIVLEAGSHYGDPDNGCLPDEEIVRVGTGRVCSPKIASDRQSDPPVPQCHIGGVTPARNGCPVDVRRLGSGSLAWPVCLGKSNSTDGYANGEFHCMLVCPCPTSSGKDCGAAADVHCPGDSRCERGSLMSRTQGLCTYHGSPDLKGSIVVV